MSDFLLYFLIALLFLTPPALIIFGICVRSESYGIVCFMAGCAGLAVFLVGFLSEFVCNVICRFLYVFGIGAAFHDTSFVFLLLFGSCMYGSYQAFRLIYQWNARKVIGIAKRFICQMQSPSYPPCEKLVLSAISDGIAKSKSFKESDDIQRYSEMLVYNIATDFIISTRFHTPVTGGLTPTGEALYHLCVNCLNHFLDVGYVSSVHYSKSLSMLEECKYHDFFSGPQIY